MEVIPTDDAISILDGGRPRALVAAAADEAGAVDITLFDRFARLFVLARVRDDGDSILSLFDQSGKLRCTIIQTSDGSPSVMAIDESGRPAFSVQTLPSGVAEAQT